MVKIYTKSSYGSIIIKGMCFILIATLFITLSGFSPVAAQQVREIDSYISEIGNVNPQKAARLSNLVYDVQPTVYINDGAFSPIGTGSMLVAQIDTGDFNRLLEGHVSLETVSLLMIHIKDRTELQALRLPTSLLQVMPNLEFVFFSLGFDAVQGENFSGLQGFDAPQIELLYESARPF